MCRLCIVFLDFQGSSEKRACCLADGRRANRSTRVAYHFGVFCEGDNRPCNSGSEVTTRILFQLYRSGASLVDRCLVMIYYTVVVAAEPESGSGVFAHATPGRIYAWLSGATAAGLSSLSFSSRPNDYYDTGSGAY